MKVNFLDLKRINASISEELVQACARVVDSGWYINGAELAKFEREFADYCGVKYCIGVANGLDALTLTLRAWKVLGKLKSGDEVIVPANTYIATILAITENDLVPILVEPDNRTFNIAIDRISEAITKDPRYHPCPSVWAACRYAGDSSTCRSVWASCIRRLCTGAWRPLSR